MNLEATPPPPYSTTGDTTAVSPEKPGAAIRRGAGIFVFAVVWFGAFSLLGIDPHHDGVMMKPAADVASGAMIFRDTFCQYGAMSIWLQAAAIKIFGAELLVIKLLTVLFYAGALVLADKIWRRFLSRGFAWLNLGMCFALAPELLVTFHPWSSVYALFFMLLAAELLLEFLESGKILRLIPAGAAAAGAFLCRHPCGVAAGGAAVATLLLMCARPENRRQCPTSLAAYLGGVAALIIPFTALLTATGSWPDYIRQCVIYVAGFARERGGGGFDFQKLSESLFPLGTIVGRFDLFFTLLPLVAVTMLLLGVRAIIHRRDTSLRRLMLVSVLLLGIGSWHQYYPVPCVRHTYWAALPMFGAYALLLQMIRRRQWRPALKWVLLAAVALPLAPPTLIRLTGGALRLAGVNERVGVAIPGLRGMRIFPSEAAGMHAVYDTFNRQPAELRERGLFNHTRDGLFSVMVKDAGYPRPMFVNWGSAVYTDYPERARQFVAATRPVVLTSEPEDRLPFPGYHNEMEFIWNDQRFRVLIPDEFVPAARHADF